MAKNAPGKHYRKGLTLAALFAMFPDDATAEQWFADIRWPNDVGCPRCGSVNVQGGTTHPTMHYRCRDCRKFFSVKTGTVMQSSKLGCRTWAIAIYLLNTGIKGRSSMKLHRDLGISQKAAWHLAHRIRETWDDQQAAFAGPVEVDETYTGGEERNKHESKRLHAGRGAVGKTAVVGVKDRATGSVSAAVVEATDGPRLRGLVRARVAQEADVYTDDAAAYHGLDNHESVQHGAGEYVRGIAHTNGIESFSSMLKRGYYGTYHRMSPKHLSRYVAEFSGRHNIRNRDTVEQMALILRGMVGKRLKYSDLVA